jgi:hypothetical protein
MPNRYNELSADMQKTIDAFINNIASSTWSDKTEADNIKIITDAHKAVRKTCCKNM